jgi:hypothetical protein
MKFVPLCAYRAAPVRPNQSMPQILIVSKQMRLRRARVGVPERELDP